MTALQILKQIKQEEQTKLYPSVPAYAIPAVKYDDSTSNGLTKCIIEFLKLTGNHGERTGNEGRTIDSRKQVTDVIGRTKTIGTVKRIPSSGTKGTSDIKAIIQGRMVAIEVKIGKDRQSDAQKDYQAMIEKAGGIYWIVKSFEDFYEKYTLISK
jgi:hypothetical protein